MSLNSDPLRNPNVQWIVLFDAVGTVLQPARSVADTYFELGARFGSKLTRDQVKARFYQARESVFGVRGEIAQATSLPALPSSEEIEKRLWSELVHQVFRDVSRVDALFVSLWEHYAMPASWMVYEDVVGCFQRLLAMKTKIALASNFDSRLLAISDCDAVLKQLDWVFCSSLVGYRKPDRRFYETILKQIAADSTSAEEHRFVMVGDDFENDFVAPSSLGWNCFYLDRHNTSTFPTSLQSLQELPDRLLPIQQESV